MPHLVSVPYDPEAFVTNQLHRKLSSFGVLLLTLSCLSPVLSIYAIGSDVLLHVGTGAAIVFICGIGVAVVWAVVYAELGSAYPYAGGDYVGVGSILGPWVGFASLTVWAVTQGSSNAILAKTVATYVCDLVPAASPVMVTFVALGAGLAHPARSLAAVVLHPTTLGVTGTMGPVAMAAMALAGVSAAYATTGGNQAIAFGEELAEPHRHMGGVILLAGLIGAFATAPLAVFNALIVGIMFAARLFFSFGRDGIFHRRVNSMLAKVHRSTGAPRAATWAVGLLAAACCLLDTHALVVFTSGLTVYCLGLVSFAVLVGRSRRLTGQPGYWRSLLFPLAPILGLLLAVAFGIADLLDADAGRPSLLLLGAMIAAGLLWHHFVLRRREGGWVPRVESAPAVLID